MKFCSTLHRKSIDFEMCDILEWPTYHSFNKHNFTFMLSGCRCKAIFWFHKEINTKPTCFLDLKACKSINQSLTLYNTICSDWISKHFKHQPKKMWKKSGHKISASDSPSRRIYHRVGLIDWLIVIYWSFVCISLWKSRW